MIWISVISSIKDALDNAVAGFIREEMEKIDSYYVHLPKCKMPKTKKRGDRFSDIEQLHNDTVNEFEAILRKGYRVKVIYEKTCSGHSPQCPNPNNPLL